MAQGQGGSNGPKYLAACVFGVIAIILVVNGLGLHPRKVTGGAFSVEFQDGTPVNPNPGASPPVRDTAKLEARVRELEGQLHAGTLPMPDSGVGTAAPARTRSMVGVWRAGLLSMGIAQSGNQAVVQVYASGILSSAGAGTLNGSTLNVEYINGNYVSGRMDVTISDDGATLNVTDYGTGSPQSFVMYRAQ
jgi:hypothetical protein